MDWIIQEAPSAHDFCVFHDPGNLSLEPVTDVELFPITLSPGLPFASWAWSANCEWYFIVYEDGIALLNIHTNSGVLCKKKTLRFIEAFSNWPTRKARR